MRFIRGQLSLAAFGTADGGLTDFLYQLLEPEWPMSHG